MTDVDVRPLAESEYRPSFDLFLASLHEPQRTGGGGGGRGGAPPPRPGSYRREPERAAGPAGEGGEDRAGANPDQD
ncbi:hypothetical protein LCD36_12730 [Saccharopolyspora sp. 6T]|uniref:hypothetical protein n=1 Tax=Saccharopolyspora sp. 6T TaxID=2877238 RepID=UPI001CD38EAC|nr:hypothetical protein [Saccharopolyspora sp. 6T]MCA1187297.1 hypothetical protein [Saccharopolyspora sp. 6T]